MKTKLWIVLLSLLLPGVAVWEAAGEMNQELIQRATGALERGDYELALFSMEVVLKAEPTNTQARLIRGSAYDMKGEWDKAIIDLSEGIRVNSKDPSAFAHRAHAYTMKAEWDRAISDASASIRLDPKRATVYKTRGYAYFHKGEHAKADKDWVEAARLEPGDAWAFNSRAWLLSTSTLNAVRNGKEAVKAAQTACELTSWKKWWCVGTLAAAFAETGDYDQAQKLQKQAIDMTGPTPDDRRELRRRLLLYEQHKPVHEPP